MPLGDAVLLGVAAALALGALGAAVWAVGWLVWAAVLAAGAGAVLLLL